MDSMESVTKNILEIKWDDTYNLNVPIIDEEHKKFIKIINKVTNITNQDYSDREEIAVVLYEMIMHALNHFKTEEEYMRKYKYSEYLVHQEEHNDFIKKTVDFSNRTIRDDYDITNEVLEYLQVWLANHIQGTDKKLVKCLSGNGLI